ncbi:b1a3ab11-01c6-44fe-a067-f9f9cab5fdce [Sclerotinia trifoliorum]|uniref:B1a3ab11-01c6-44fe-a067-f9f9cab5fdce n=1 Tax=Sclerotinia trifoliorum TaxID=28548 RepID=A0A8H2W0P3_9HELO|nr:b1a3ab11-01c6-44fe-a067-f9f9cab5fdce [Sclerotinia trifoliorum]
MHFGGSNAGLSQNERHQAPMPGICLSGPTCLPMAIFLYPIFQPKILACSYITRSVIFSNLTYRYTENMRNQKINC